MTDAQIAELKALAEIQGDIADAQADDSSHAVVLVANLEALIARLEAAQRERELALGMLADWCVAIDANGTAWDAWDDHYKEAMYRENPLRGVLDQMIDEAKRHRVEWDKSNEPTYALPAPPKDQP